MASHHIENWVPGFSVSRLQNSTLFLSWPTPHPLNLTFFVHDSLAHNGFLFCSVCLSSLLLPQDLCICSSFYMEHLPWGPYSIYFSIIALTYEYMRCLLPLECKFQESRDLVCDMHSILYLQYLKWCLVHRKHSTNIDLVNEWINNYHNCHLPQYTWQPLLIRIFN
jgi:hypothetical protein